MLKSFDCMKKTNRKIHNNHIWSFVAPIIMLKIFSTIISLKEIFSNTLIGKSYGPLNTTSLLGKLEWSKCLRRSKPPLSWNSAGKWKSIPTTPPIFSTKSPSFLNLMWYRGSWFFFHKTSTKTRFPPKFQSLRTTGSWTRVSIKIRKYLVWEWGEYRRI